MLPHGDRVRDELECRFELTGPPEPRERRDHRTLARSAPEERTESLAELGLGLELVNGRRAHHELPVARELEKSLERGRHVPEQGRCAGSNGRVPGSGRERGGTLVDLGREAVRSVGEERGRRAAEVRVAVALEHRDGAPLVEDGSADPRVGICERGEPILLSERARAELLAEVLGAEVGAAGLALRELRLPCGLGHGATESFEECSRRGGTVRVARVFEPARGELESALVPARVDPPRSERAKRFVRLAKQGGERSRVDLAVRHRLESRLHDSGIGIGERTELGRRGRVVDEAELAGRSPPPGVEVGEGRAPSALVSGVGGVVGRREDLRAERG